MAAVSIFKVPSIKIFNVCTFMCSVLYFFRKRFTPSIASFIFAGWVST